MEEREQAGKTYVRLKKQLQTIQKRSVSKAYHSKSSSGSTGLGTAEREVCVYIGPCLCVHRVDVHVRVHVLVHM